MAQRPDRAPTTWEPIQVFLDKLSEQEELEWIKARGEAKMLGLDLSELTRGQKISSWRPKMHWPDRRSA